MEREITQTKDKTVKFLMERENLSLYEAINKYDVEVKKRNIKLKYCVTFGDYSLCDIPEGVSKKTPAKYFDNLDHAIIFQLKGLINLYVMDKDDSITYEDYQHYLKELKPLLEQYPEYAI